MSGSNDYSGQNINKQVAGSYTDALGIANDQVDLGAMFGQKGIDWLKQAAGQYGTAAGMTPSDVSAGQLAGTDLSPYMNPYQHDVIDSSMSELYRQEDLKRQALGDEAMKSGAWGGDRQGVEAASNRRDFNDQRMGLLSQLNSANFLNAQNMANTDIGRRFDADKTNQGMRQSMSQFGTQGMSNLGAGAMDAGMKWFNPSNLAALSQQGFNYQDTIAKNNLQAGALQQQQQQQIIDAAKLAWEQFQNRPIQGLAAITGSTQIPSGGTTTTSQNPGALGILGTGLQAFGSLASMPMLGMSDKTMKTDITPLGKDKGTGLKMYAYRYKGDPKTYPKVVGPMAQEVKKKYPDKVKKISGRLTVETGLLHKAIGVRR